jgi:hypothetical protein
MRSLLWNPLAKSSGHTHSVCVCVCACQPHQYLCWPATHTAAAAVTNTATITNTATTTASITNTATIITPSHSHHTHTHTHTHTYTHAHTRARTHAHTHTHTNAHAYLQPGWLVVVKLSRSRACPTWQRAAKLMRCTLLCAPQPRAANHHPHTTIKASHVPGRTLLRARCVGQMWASLAFPWLDTDYLYPWHETHNLVSRPTHHHCQQCIGQAWASQIILRPHILDLTA